MQTELSYYDDEIDFHELITTLLKGWKVILFLAILGGAATYGYSALQVPLYEAKASLLIDQEALSLTSSPITLLKSDEVCQLVADHLEVEKSSLPLPTVEADKMDKTLFTLSVQSIYAKEAAAIANAWAEVGSSWLIQQAREKDVLLEKAELDIQEADRAFVAYLEKHDLTAWTWTELSFLTGVSNTSVSNTSVSNFHIETSRLDQLPLVTDTERLEIAQLMRDRITKESYYSRLLSNIQKHETTLSFTPPTVLAYANIPLHSTNSRPLLNTALGMIAGGMLGIFWVFAAAWWKGIDSKDKENAIKANS